jgi:hypothetical protein
MSADAPAEDASAPLNGNDVAPAHDPSPKQVDDVIHAVGRAVPRPPPPPPGFALTVCADWCINTAQPAQAEYCLSKGTPSWVV